LNKSQSKPGRIEEINFLRGFGVLAVIAIHTTGYFTEIKSFNTLVLLNLWTDIFSQFAVPMFILISGFVLAKNYRFNISLKGFYQKRMHSIIPQYLIFSVAYTIFNNWIVMQSNPLASNIKLILKNILHSDASYHLWFFSIIIQFYIFYPMILKVYTFFERKGREELLIALLLLIQTLCMVGMHTRFFSGIKINFIDYLFYFGVGIYMSNRLDRLKKSSSLLTPFLLIASLALTVGASFFIIIGLTTGYSYNSIPAYFLIGPELIYPFLRISTFLLFFNISCSLVGKRSVLAKVIYKIGNYSFGIYLIHIFFNQNAIKILKNHHIDYANWVFYLSVYAITVVLSYVAVRLISFIPYSYYIIGSQTKKRSIQKI